MSAPSDLCGSCNDTRANHEHHFESECQRFRERGDSGPCPWCERTDDHAHEFVDVLSAECDHELARLRAESAELKQKVSDIEAETMTLTSERDTARMGQDELLAKLRSEGQDWRLAAAAFEANAAEIAELRRQLEAVDRALGLPPDRAPRRLELLVELRKAASAKGLDAALSDAERRVVDCAVHWAKQENIRGGERELSAAVGELLLMRLRAAEAEAEHG